MTLDLGHGPILTDGGCETTLIFENGIDLPHFASIVLMRDADGRKALEGYFRPYLELAAERRTGFILESPTWRASPDWAAPLGFDLSDLEDLNAGAIALMRDLRAEYSGRIDPLLVSGCIGPRGDGYLAENRMSAEEAADYHAFQAQIFAREGCDLVSAITMTNIAEGQGVARAAAAAGLPSVISFTVETDARLPSGETLADAIATLDADRDARPAYYMINCAHPDHFADELLAGSDWASRIRGLRTNASRLSHAELDACEELDAGNPQELGRQTASLAAALPNLQVFGGCCGTDHRHVSEMANAVLGGHAKAA